MTRPQVRLDADVAEALQRAADRANASLSTTANQWLRRALGQQPATGPRPPVDRRPGTASIQPPKGAACTHPVNRRVGGVCMVCHKRVGGPH